MQYTFDAKTKKLYFSDGRIFTNIGRQTVSQFQVGDLIGRPDVDVAKVADFGPWIVLESELMEDQRWRIIYDVLPGTPQRARSPMTYAGSKNLQDFRWVPETFVITEMEIP